jgi:hypothetical protein
MPHLIQLEGSVFAIQAMPEMVRFAVAIRMPMDFLMLILIVLSQLARKITVQVFQILVKRTLMVTVRETHVKMTLTMTAFSMLMTIVLIYQIPIKLTLMVTAWVMLVIIVPMTTILDRRMKMEISLVTLVTLEPTQIMMELLMVPTTVLLLLTLIN